MIYAIIAAGEGSRLTEEGYTGLKPMVLLNGEMLIDRLIKVFVANSAESIIIIINEKSEALKSHLEQLQLDVPVHILVKDTPSSLHSFDEILKFKPDAAAMCLTTTDTIFEEAEFGAYIEAFQADTSNHGLMAVTSFIDDESPLYVDFDSNHNITAFSDTVTPTSTSVSGGIYCLRKEALNVARISVAQGVSRMRNFQKAILTNNLTLKAYPFSKIIDIDHVADIEKAQAFLDETSIF